MGLDFVSTFSDQNAGSQESSPATASVAKAISSAFSSVWTTNGSSSAMSPPLTLNKPATLFTQSFLYSHTNPSDHWHKGGGRRSIVLGPKQSNQQAQRQQHSQSHTDSDENVAHLAPVLLLGHSIHWRLLHHWGRNVDDVGRLLRLRPTGPPIARPRPSTPGWPHRSRPARAPTTAWPPAVPDGQNGHIVHCCTHGLLLCLLLRSSSSASSLIASTTQ